jgi:hypothetical protein
MSANSEYLSLCQNYGQVTCNLTPYILMSFPRASPPWHEPMKFPSAPWFGSGLKGLLGFSLYGDFAELEVKVSRVE